MRTFVNGLNTHKKLDLQTGQTACEPAFLASAIQTYENLVADGEYRLAEMEKTAFGYHAFQVMVKRLRDYEDSYLLFLKDYRAPFTDNLSLSEV